MVSYPSRNQMIKLPQWIVNKWMKYLIKEFLKNNKISSRVKFKNQKKKLKNLERKISGYHQCRRNARHNFSESTKKLKSLKSEKRGIRAIWRNGRPINFRLYNKIKKFYRRRKKNSIFRKSLSAKHAKTSIQRKLNLIGTGMLWKKRGINSDKRSSRQKNFRTRLSR